MSILLGTLVLLASLWLAPAAFALDGEGTPTFFPHGEDAGISQAQPPDIVIERAHLLIRITDEGVQVGEMVVVSNLSQGMYMGSEVAGQPAATLRFFLPAGATQLIFEAGELGQRFIEVEGGFVDTQPLPPGEAAAQLLFSYMLPAQKAVWTLEHRYAYPVKALNVLVAGEGWDMFSDQVAYVGTMGSDPLYMNFSAQDVPANQVVRLIFAPRKGQPAAGARPAHTSVQPILLWITLALGLLLVIALLTYPLWRSLVLGERSASHG